MSVGAVEPPILSEARVFDIGLTYLAKLKSASNSSGDEECVFAAKVIDKKKLMSRCPCFFATTNES